MRDNYEIARQQAAELFAKSDRVASTAAYFGLRQCGGYIYLRFCELDYRVNCENGQVERALCAQLAEDGTAGQTWQVAGFEDSLAIYDLLGYSKPGARAAGSFINLNSLSGKLGAGGSAPSTGGFFAKYQANYAGKIPELRAAMQATGGEVLPQGAAGTAGADACLQLTVFADLQIQIRFWDADEEFPAQLMIFFDENALDFVHFEAAWYIAGFVLDRIVL